MFTIKKCVFIYWSHSIEVKNLNSEAHSENLGKSSGAPQRITRGRLGHLTTIGGWWGRGVIAPLVNHPLQFLSMKWQSIAMVLTTSTH